MLIKLRLLFVALATTIALSTPAHASFIKTMASFESNDSSFSIEEIGNFWQSKKGFRFSKARYSSKSSVSRSGSGKFSKLFKNYRSVRNARVQWWSYNLYSDLNNDPVSSNPPGNSNPPATAVPVPAAAVLFASAIGILGGLRFRKS